MNRSRLDRIFLVFLVCFAATLLIPAFLTAQDKPADDETEQTLPPQKQIIEELTVTGNAPVTQPISTVTLLPKASIEKLLSRNLSDIVSLTPGVTVSEGQKAESSINLRGMSSKRITLMVDGVPIYEPYFNSFDLKTFSTTNVESVKVIKGANSVLYGANTLGGVIDITTQRPSQPFVKLKGLLSENKSSFLSGMAGASMNRFSFLANFAWDKSDGFKYEKDGERVLRALSNYNRLDWGAKMYYHPTDASEFLAEVMVTDSSYGIPASTIPQIKSRYWVFDDWQRLQTNLGYSTPFWGDGTFKARAFYVYHFNVLQDFNNPQLAVKRWESTYKNSSFGANVTGEKPLGDRNTLKFGLHGIMSEVKQQGDIGDPWETFDRTILSMGLEDHLMLSGKWKIVGGLGIDYLKKNSGDTVTRFNPIFGLRFSPTDYMDAHLSLSMKSRFPSMKSLYSSKGGNPDLLDELGRSIELGMSWRKGLDIQASVFFNRYDDLIQSYRGLEGYKFEQNIGRAEIKGFEIALGKTWNKVSLSANYTFLDAMDIDTVLKLDYTPDHQFGLFASIGEIKGFTLSAWINTVSSSTSLLGSTPPFSQLAIDGYTLINVVLSKKIAWFTLLLKAENLGDAVYFSEPGFPMKGRTISFGIDFDLKKYR